LGRTECADYRNTQPLFLSRLGNLVPSDEMMMRPSLPGGFILPPSPNRPAGRISGSRITLGDLRRSLSTVSVDVILDSQINWPKSLAPLIVITKNEEESHCALPNLRFSILRGRKPSSLTAAAPIATPSSLCPLVRSRMSFQRTDCQDLPRRKNRAAWIFGAERPWVISLNADEWIDGDQL